MDRTGERLRADIDVDDHRSRPARRLSVALLRFRLRQGTQFDLRHRERDLSRQHGLNTPKRTISFGQVTMSICLAPVAYEA